MTRTVQREDFSYWTRIPTRWSDHDRLGHVNNTRFFTFDEDARLNYFESLWTGDSRLWKDYGFILASLGCDFIAQLHHPAQVDTGFRIAKLGRSSFQTVAGMFQGERLVAVTRGVLVWFDYAGQKSIPIPDDVRKMVRQRERLAPEEG